MADNEDELVDYDEEEVRQLPLARGGDRPHHVDKWHRRRQPISDLGVQFWIRIFLPSLRPEPSN